jgi:hypothetical protein
MKFTRITPAKIFSAVALLVVLLVSGAAKANNDKVKPADIPVEVKYLGSVDYRPIFQVNLNNELNEEITVTLKDIDDNVLYTETFKGKVFSKKFQFEKADFEDLQIKLVISSKKRNQKEIFTIDKSTRIVETIAVNKLN